jgi:hypothetical protein
MRERAERMSIIDLSGQIKERLNNDDSSRR